MNNKQRLLTTLLLTTCYISLPVMASTVERPQGTSASEHQHQPTNALSDHGYGQYKTKSFYLLIPLMNP